MTSQQVRVIRVVADTKGSKELKDLAKQFGQVNRSTKRMDRNLNGLTNTLKAFAATLGLRFITQASDEFQLFRDRIKVLTGDAEKANDVFNDIVTSARLTKTSVSALGTVYNRVALATSDLGLSSDQVLATTTALQQTFRLSGASIAEATGATIQLTQGLAAGALRGQELRSVLEANAVIANILTEEFKINRGSLLKLAETGAFTSDKVLAGLAKRFERINQDASKLGTTFEQSFIIILDAVKVKISELNDQFGISSKFSAAVLFAIGNFETLQNIFIGIAVGAIPAMIKGFKALTAVMAANPITAALTATTILILEFERFEKIAKVAIKSVQLEFSKLILVITSKVIPLLSSNVLTKPFADMARVMLRLATNAIPQLSNEIDDLNDSLKDSFGGKTQDEIDKLRKRLEAAFAKLKDGKGAVNAVSKGLAEINSEFKKTGDLEKYLSEFRKIQTLKIEDEFAKGKIQNLEDYNKKLEDLEKTIGNIRQRYGDDGGILDAIGRGSENYLNSIESLSDGIASVTESAFGRFEGAIFDSLKGSQDAFAKFTQAVLDDLLKLAIRLTITNQLAASLKGFLNGGSVGSGATATPTASANGAKFNGGAFSKGANPIPHYNGGIVDKLTAFPMSGGRVGTMAEKGPEAIVPLQRTKDGKLGVNTSGGGTQITVINNTPAEVETSETQGPNGQRQIQFVIKEAVKGAISDGSLDKTFKNNFNLNRRGR